MVVATFGILPYIVGMEVMYFNPSSKLPGLIINNIGWILMVVAQSVVLYSRLGIVLGNMQSRILSFTKWMIIVDAIVFYTLATGKSHLHYEDATGTRRLRRSSNRVWHALLSKSAFRRRLHLC